MFAKIFSQILDSSIADDAALRHFFMDLLVLADPEGIVDMTPESISARTRLPLDSVKLWLTRLQEPDKRSRSDDHEGRRIVLIDPHRDWGWLIVNFQKYHDIRDHFDRKAYMRNYMRELRKNGCKTSVKRQSNAVKPVNSCKLLLAHPDPDPDQKNKEGTSPPRSTFKVPSREEVYLQCSKAGIPSSEAEKFWNHYCANGWKVGKNRMQSLSHAVGGWAARWREKVFQNGNGPIDRKNIKLTPDQMVQIAAGNMKDPRYD